jgi:hypothetical protein
MLTDKDLEELRQERHDDYVAEARQERAASKWSNQGPPAGFGGEYATITGLTHGPILIQANQDEANLIAAAPDMFRALKMLADTGRMEDSTWWREAIDARDAAIAKAKGGAS